MLLLLTAAEVKGHLHVFEYNTELWLVQTLIMFKWLESINSLPAGSVNASLTSHWQEAKQLTDRVCACVGVCLDCSLKLFLFKPHTHTHTHSHTQCLRLRSLSRSCILFKTFVWMLHSCYASRTGKPAVILTAMFPFFSLAARYKDIKLAKQANFSFRLTKWIDISEEKVCVFHILVVKKLHTKGALSNFHLFMLDFRYQTFWD